MKQFSAVAIIAALSMLGTGCATKKYVAQQIQPVQQKVDTLSTNLDTTNKNLAATDEVAKGADANATKALNELNDTNGKVNDMGGKVEGLNGQLGQINAALGNLDDYKPAGTTTVNFKFNSSKLSPEATAALDSFVSSNIGSAKRYFVALQGYTDRVGGDAYNLELSRRRAEAVQTYLIGKHSIPVFRVMLVGFGKDNPVDPDKTKAAQAKNRRVDATLYTAPVSGGSSGQ
jgi:outer membrane protein OmpA-like peptidoglycan-associated protein